MVLLRVAEKQREAGQITIPITAVLTYRHDNKTHRTSRSAELVVKLDTTRLRRRLDSKLDLLMGKVPNELKG